MVKHRGVLSEPDLYRAIMLNNKSFFTRSLSYYKLCFKYQKMFIIIYYYVLNRVRVALYNLHYVNGWDGRLCYLT